jgi:hypothetical protein
MRWAIASAAGLIVFAVCWWGLESGAGWHLGDALGLAAIPFSIVFGIAGYWAGRETPSDSTGSSSGESPGTGVAALADWLASVVGQQWHKEAGIRRLYDPYPLPVSWTAADRR